MAAELPGYQWLDSSSDWASRRAERLSVVVADPPTRKGHPMTPTIIIDVEDSERGRDALALGYSLGATTSARLVTVTSAA